MLLVGPFHASMRPSQSIPQAPRNSSDAPAVQLSMRNPNARAHTHTPKGQTTVALLSLSTSRDPWSENDTLGQEKETPSNQHNHDGTNPFCLVVFIVFGLTTVQSAISLSSSGHKLNTEFLLSLGFPPQPCGRRASCVPKVPEEPTSLWLAHLRPPMPYTTTHLGKGTAPAPSKAHAVCVARLKLRGNTSNSVQSPGLRLWQTHQEQRQ